MMVPSGWLLARAENNHWHWLQYYMIIILFRVSTVMYGRIPNSHTVSFTSSNENWKGLANIGQNVDYMSSNYLGHYNDVPLILSLFATTLHFSMRIGKLSVWCHVGIILVIMRSITRQIDKKKRQVENGNHNYPRMFVARVQTKWFLLYMYISLNISIKLNDEV